jgi:hypothetical protein
MIRYDSIIDDRDTIEILQLGGSDNAVFKMEIIFLLTCSLNPFVHAEFW